MSDASEVESEIEEEVGSEEDEEYSQDDFDASKSMPGASGGGTAGVGLAAGVAASPGEESVAEEASYSEDFDGTMEASKSGRDSARGHPAAKASPGQRNSRPEASYSEDFDGTMEAEKSAYGSSGSADAAVGLPLAAPSGGSDFARRDESSDEGEGEIEESVAELTGASFTGGDGGGGSARGLGASGSARGLGASAASQSAGVLSESTPSARDRRRIMEEEERRRKEEEEKARQRIEEQRRQRAKAAVEPERPPMAPPAPSSDASNNEESEDFEDEFEEETVEDDEMTAAWKKEREEAEAAERKKAEEAEAKRKQAEEAQKELERRRAAEAEEKRRAAEAIKKAEEERIRKAEEDRTMAEELELKRKEEEEERARKKREEEAEQARKTKEEEDAKLEAQKQQEAEAEARKKKEEEDSKLEAQKKKEAEAEARKKKEEEEAKLEAQKKKEAEAEAQRERLKREEEELAKKREKEDKEKEEQDRRDKAERERLQREEQEQLAKKEEQEQKEKDEQEKAELERKKQVEEEHLAKERKDEDEKEAAERRRQEEQREKEEQEQRKREEEDVLAKKKAREEEEKAAKKKEEEETKRREQEDLQHKQKKDAREELEKKNRDEEEKRRRDEEEASRQAQEKKETEERRRREEEREKEDQEKRRRDEEEQQRQRIDEQHEREKVDQRRREDEELARRKDYEREGDEWDRRTPSDQRPLEQHRYNEPNAHSEDWQWRGSVQRRTEDVWNDDDDWQWRGQNRWSGQADETRPYREEDRWTAGWRQAWDDEHAGPAWRTPPSADQWASNNASSWGGREQRAEDTFWNHDTKWRDVPSSASQWDWDAPRAVEDSAAPSWQREAAHWHQESSAAPWMKQDMAQQAGGAEATPWWKRDPDPAPDDDGSKPWWREDPEQRVPAAAAADFQPTQAEARATAPACANEVGALQSPAEVEIPKLGIPRADPEDVGGSSRGKDAISSLRVPSIGGTLGVQNQQARERLTSATGIGTRLSLAAVSALPSFSDLPPLPGSSLPASGGLEELLLRRNATQNQTFAGDVSLGAAEAHGGVAATNGPCQRLLAPGGAGVQLFAREGSPAARGAALDGPCQRLLAEAAIGRSVLAGEGAGTAERFAPHAASQEDQLPKGVRGDAPRGPIHAWLAEPPPLPGAAPGQAWPPRSFASELAKQQDDFAVYTPATEEQPSQHCGAPESTLMPMDVELGDLSQEDFGRRMAHATAIVVHEMLQLKYGVGLDVAGFAAKVEAQFSSYTLLSAGRLAEAINSRPELVFAAQGGHGRLLKLRLHWRELPNFEELRKAVRVLPGTASVVAITSAAGGHAVDAVSVFRLGYADVATAVGRCWQGARWPVRHFGAAEFCGAAFLDPEVLACTRRGAPPGSEAAIPRTPEYNALSAMLFPDGSSTPSAAHASTSRTPPGFLAVVHATTASDEVLRKMAELLERPDLEPEAGAEIFRKLCSWLKKDPDAAMARQAVAIAGAHGALVAALRRCKSHLDTAAEACRVVGLAARHHAGNAVSFVDCNGSQEVINALEQHMADKDLHRHGLYALGCLAHYGGGAKQIVAAGAVDVALKSLAIHRGSPSVQINGCELLRSLAELGGAPMDDLGRVAQEAKRSFPRNVPVHSAADNLLTLVIPRTVGAVGALMDMQLADESVQISGMRSIGQLASYGGVAWKSAAVGAVSRVLRAMSNHHGSVSLQAVALWVLGRLAERVDAPTAGMLDAVERARKLHPDSALVKQHAQQLKTYLVRLGATARV